MNPQEQQEIENRVAKQVEAIMRRYTGGGAFPDRKITDSPTDSFSVVNRKYVTLNGTLANRPPASVATIGQSYFATDTNIPMVFNGTNWRNGVGSVVASG